MLETTVIEIDGRAIEIRGDRLTAGTLALEVLLAAVADMRLGCNQADQAAA